MMKRVRSWFRPDASDSTPLYLQLARQLGEAIRDGRCQPHEALPSERLLSETLGLSRVTTRKAIDQLVTQGLVVRRQGSGNYIAPHLEQPLSHLTGFSEELRNRGYKPGSRWLSRAVTAATRDEERLLGLAPGARVARLKRLRLADGVVMAYEEAVLPVTVLPDPAALDGSLYEHLAAIRKAPARAVQRLRAVNVPARMARQLGLAPGHAVLAITRVAHLASGKAVEVTYSYCRSDYYEFVAEMRRKP